MSVKIVDRIKKLLNLAYGTTHVAEATSAKSVVSKLLAENDLQIISIENNSLAIVDAEGTVNPDIKHLSMIPPRFHWRRHLLYTVANAYQCRVFYTISGYNIIGSYEDINYVQALFGQLSKLVNYTEDAAWHQRGQFGKFMAVLTNSPAPIEEVWRRSFHFGFVKGVDEKLRVVKHSTSVEEESQTVEDDAKTTSQYDDLVERMQNDSEFRQKVREHEKARKTQIDNDGVLCGLALAQEIIFKPPSEEMEPIQFTRGSLLAATYE